MAASAPIPASFRAVREHYDFFLPFYRVVWGDHLHHGLFLSGRESARRAQVQMIEHCAAGCELGRGARLLDVGCGHGGSSVYLARKYGCRVTALTLSPRQAARAARNARRAGVASQVAILVENAERWEFPPAAFDVIWMLESSEHFCDKPAMLRQAARALVSGGRLAISAWTGSMARPLVREVARMGVCPSLQTGDDYARQIRAAGLLLTAQQDLSAQVRRTWEICRRRARWLRPIVPLLPRAHQPFAQMPELMLRAYRSGDLGYTTLFARK